MAGKMGNEGNFQTPWEDLIYTDRLWGLMETVQGGKCRSQVVGYVLPGSTLIGWSKDTIGMSFESDPPAGIDYSKEPKGQGVVDFVEPYFIFYSQCTPFSTNRRYLPGLSGLGWTDPFLVDPFLFTI